MVSGFVTSPYEYCFISCGSAINTRRLLKSAIFIASNFLSLLLLFLSSIMFFPILASKTGAPIFLASGDFLLSQRLNGFSFRSHLYALKSLLKFFCLFSYFLLTRECFFFFFLFNYCLLRNNIKRQRLQFSN